MASGIKRLFFGVEVLSPWPEHYPKGRLLDPAHRHMTLAFLGNVEYQKVADLLPSFPTPSFKVGLAGSFNKPLFLPERHPHVVAWHAEWLDDPQHFLEWQKTLSKWLKDHGFSINERDFLPHVTVCRSPFYPREWKKAFSPLPYISKDIHLFESVGNLQYVPCWSVPIRSPFEEIEHTADIAFVVRAENIDQLHNHAQIALAFRFPKLLSFLQHHEKITSLEDSIIALNEIISRADGEIGCPYKAVSFHGELFQESDGTLKWEMIVDV